VPVRRWGSWLLGLVLLVGGIAGFALARGSSQPEVSVNALPTAATVRETAIYVDCSKVNSVAYFSDNPCQTFVLLTSRRFGSATRFLTAETRHMTRSGWRHSAAQLVDYDGANSGMASRTESWVAPGHRACAYVATDQDGVAAEAKALSPYDPYDIPHGVYVFYRKAKAANPRQTLWVRLRPPNHGGRCIG
jgi:hypothetical protein